MGSKRGEKDSITLVLSVRLWRYIVGYLVVLPVLFAAGIFGVGFSTYLLLTHGQSRQQAVRTEGKVVHTNSDGSVTYKYQAEYTGELSPNQDDEIKDKIELSYDPTEPSRVFVKGYEDDELSTGSAGLVIGAALMVVLPVAAVIDYKNARRKAEEVATEKSTPKTTQEK